MTTSPNHHRKDTPIMASAEIDHRREDLDAGTVEVFPPRESSSGSALALLLTGPGPWSVDAWCMDIVHVIFG